MIKKICIALLICPIWFGCNQMTEKTTNMGSSNVQVNTKLEQNIFNEWVINKEIGDELKGTISTITKIYRNENGDAFVLYKNGKYVGAIAYTSFFNYKSDYGIKFANYTYVGLYDINDKLIERIKQLALGNNIIGTTQDKGFVLDEENPRLLYCIDEKINNKIIDYLENNVGFVRIVIDKYNDEDFDLKVPCFKN